jgi:phosphoenolpyruvate---glycerone phosphotransferase subunit DhaK
MSTTGKVKKIINSPDTIVTEVLDGIVALSRGALVRESGAPVLRRAVTRRDKVALVIGGGSGHEPMYSAFVGPGLADASVAGEIFAAPSPDQIATAARAVDGGKGVMFVYGNYAGDTLNFDVASEILEAEGIPCRTVLVADDAAVEKREDRRGIAGAVYQVKVAGYACERFSTLEAATAFVERARDNLRTLGVAVRAGSLPNTGVPTFEIGDDEIEIGMGMHGERGVSREKLPQADSLVADMVKRLIGDLGLKAGDRIAALIDNFGATTFMELMIVNRKLAALLAEARIDIARTDIGAYFTSQEMAGFSLTFMRLDPELEAALAAPASSPGFVQTGGA